MENKSCKKKVFYGTFIHSLSLKEFEILKNTILGINEKGVIEFIEKDVNLENLSIKEIAEKHNYTVYELFKSSPNGFFFPGFVDTHIHAPQYPNSGIFGRSTLLDWLTTYTFPLEASLKDINRAKTVYKDVVNRTLSNGTTTAAYYATIDLEPTKILTDIAFSYGQRAFIGRVCMNDNSPDFYSETFEEAKERTTEIIKYISNKDPSGERVAPIITPRFAPSCTSELLLYLGNLSKEKNIRCQTHLSENKSEIKWVKELFPNSKSYTDVYNDHNLLGDKTILAHCIHLSEDECKLIKKTDSGISHCPISNSCIASGEARVRWLLDSGIKIGLGTDVSGGYSPSILNVARHAVLVSNHLSLNTSNDKVRLSSDEVFYLATLGGAKVVSLDHLIGNFTIGKKWDAQLIDLNVENSPVDVYEWEYNNFQLLSEKWLYNGDDRNVTKVWVNGDLVVEKSTQ